MVGQRVQVGVLGNRCVKSGIEDCDLRRRLTEEGTSFREVLQEARQERAKTMLSKSGMSLAVAAEQLGYSDTAAFSRAFKEWTGLSPGRFLRQDDPPA